MDEYLNKEMFLQSMGLLGDETKYGNRDGEHQRRSYGTWMGYEIMGSVEDSIVEEDVVEVVRCKNCKHYKPRKPYPSYGGQTKSCCRSANTKVSEDDFCSYGERREGE
jgi:hypothetical protein